MTRPFDRLYVPVHERGEDRLQKLESVRRDYEIAQVEPLSAAIPGETTLKPCIRLAGLALLLASTSAAAQQATPLYKSAHAPVAARVQDLLGRMTLEEKVAQLQIGGTPLPAEFGGGVELVKDGKVDDALARRSIPYGLGQFALVSFKATSTAEAETLNALQSWEINNTRLGIPILFLAEGLHGAALPGATTFPQAIGLGSTWDRPLIEQVFAAVGDDLRATGVRHAFAPVLDLGRDPRFGRIEEMYSEDPYLTGELGLKAVQGLQGRGPTPGVDHVISTAKHFVHGQPENGTNVGPSDYSERTMREVFLAPFEKAVRTGHIGGVMASYNENDGGLPSNANPWLLKDILRQEWGFTGVVISDGAAVERLHAEQGLADSDAAAGVLALNSGVDTDLGGHAFDGLADAVRAGTVSERDIDGAVARILAAKFDAGLFEHPLVDTRRTEAVVGAKQHAQLARKAADEAIILLKNQGAMLPLDPAKIKTLAVIGPNADKIRLGTYSTPKPPYFVTVLDGVRKRLGGKVVVNYAEGVHISENDTEPGQNRIVPYKAPSPEKDAELIRQAVETARTADTVILVLGGNETVSREAFKFGPWAAYGDTDELELPGRQNELVHEIMKLGKPTVAVLLNGRPYSIQELSQSVPAIVEGWYLGQETGNALAGMLFGDVNPSGRLPVTIARNVGQLPVFYYKKPTARLGYVFNDNTPLFPFGYGLSYTSFSYGKPILDRTKIDRQGTAKISVQVTNTGKRPGTDVVQMYVHPKVSSVVQPVMRLAGFERVELEPGQSKTVSFAVGPEQLAIWDSKMKHTVEAGKVDVMVGPNSAETTAVELAVVP